MQTAGELVAVPAEFSARVQDGIHHLQRRNAHLRVNAARNAATVILHRTAPVRQQRHLNPLAPPCQRLVNRVVDNLVHQMVQSPDRRRSDVHSRPLPYGFQTLQYLNLCLVVRVRHVLLSVFFHTVSFLKV